MSQSISTFKNILFILALVFTSGSILAIPEIHRELSAAPGERLVLKLDTGATLDIQGWDRELVDILIEPGGKDAEHDSHDIERTARGVRIHSYTRNGGKSHSSNHRMTIRVPQRFDIELDSMGGSVTIAELEGTMRGKTLGGHLVLSGLKGTVDLETYGGDVRLTASEVDGKLSTKGGKVVFEEVQGGVEGRSLGGEVSYRNTDRPLATAGQDPVVISTHGGDINVDSAPAGAELKTLGGDIRVRSAADHVKAKTMGGDIAIGEIDGWVEAITMGGDVTVTMVGDPSSGNRRVDIRSMSGEVSLTVPSALAMDVEIELAYTKNSPRQYQILSDFPLTLEESDAWDYGHGTPRKTISGRGRSDSGGHKIHISTVNGNIYLKKGE